MIANARKNGLLLALFAMAATALVSVTYQATRERIESQKQQQLRAVLEQLFPAASHDNDMYHDCTLLISEQFLGRKQPQHAYLASLAGQPTGIAIETTAPDGYGGAIDLIVGVQMDGTVTGVRTLAHKETPGLGDLIDLRRNNWINSFTGRSLSGAEDKRWAVKKDGGEFDQFTGATITPRAVVRAVKNTLLFYQTHQADLFNRPQSCRSEP